jgi:hypothetical protein
MGYLDPFRNNSLKKSEGVFSEAIKINQQG